jgi:hypothetical protein
VIARLIRWSADNLVLVMIAALFCVLAGLYAMTRIPLDAIPDLSDTQVIVYTEYQGQAAASYRGSGHLSSRERHAQCAALASGPWIFFLRRLVRVRHL